jgi:hypothetical protein
MFAYNGKNQVEVLLDKYKEYMKDANDNSTKIIKEALQTHLDVVSMLVKGGADVNIKVNTTEHVRYSPLRYTHHYASLIFLLPLVRRTSRAM